MKKLALFLTFSCLASVLPAQLAAQTFRLQANIPFAFVVSGKTMPAGQYEINAGKIGNGSLMVWNEEAKTGAMAMASNPVYAGQTENPSAILNFNRYGDRYFLTQVMPGFDGVGLEFNTSAEERTTAKERAASKPEKVTVLARR